MDRPSPCSSSKTTGLSQISRYSTGPLGYPKERANRKKKEGDERITSPGHGGLARQ